MNRLYSLFIFIFVTTAYAMEDMPFKGYKLTQEIGCIASSKEELNAIKARWSHEMQELKHQINKIDALIVSHGISYVTVESNKRRKLNPVSMLELQIKQALLDQEYNRVSGEHDKIVQFLACKNANYYGADESSDSDNE